MAIIFSAPFLISPVAGELIAEEFVQATVNIANSTEICRGTISSYSVDRSRDGSFLVPSPVVLWIEAAEEKSRSWDGVRAQMTPKGIVIENMSAWCRHELDQLATRNCLKNVVHVQTSSAVNDEFRLFCLVAGGLVVVSSHSSEFIAIDGPQAFIEFWMSSDSIHGLVRGKANCYALKLSPYDSENDERASRGNKRSRSILQIDKLSGLGEIHVGKAVKGAAGRIGLLRSALTAPSAPESGRQLEYAEVAARSISSWEEKSLGWSGIESVPKEIDHADFEFASMDATIMSNIDSRLIAIGLPRFQRSRGAVLLLSRVDVESPLTMDSIIVNDNEAAYFSDKARNEFGSSVLLIDDNGVSGRLVIVSAPLFSSQPALYCYDVAGAKRRWVACPLVPGSGFGHVGEVLYFGNNKLGVDSVVLSVSPQSDSDAYMEGFSASGATYVRARLLDGRISQ